MWIPMSAAEREEFLVGVKRNALEPDELIVSVHVTPSGHRRPS